MSPDIKPPPKKQIVGFEVILVKPPRWGIARKLKLFHNYSDLR